MPSLQSCLDFSGMGLWGSFFSCCFFFFVLLKSGGKAFPKCEHSRNFHYKGRKTKEFIERGLCTRQILWDWVGGSEFFTINVLIFSNYQTNANPFPLLATLEVWKRGIRGSSSLNVLQDVALLQPQLSPTLEGEDDGFVHQLHNSDVIEITPAKGKESWVRSLRLWPIHEVLELTQFCWNSSQLPHFARICLCHIEKAGKDVLKSQFKSLWFVSDLPLVWANTQTLSSELETSPPLPVSWYELVSKIILTFFLFDDKSEEAVDGETSFSGYNKGRSSWLPFALWHFSVVENKEEKWAQPLGWSKSSSSNGSCFSLLNLSTLARGRI